jgi:ABC-type lipoprotein release transport system permease subunit
MAGGAAGAFQVSSLALGLLSVVGLFLNRYFAGRKRAYEFALLQATGLAPGQMLGLLAVEGVMVVGLGLLAGTLAGYGLTAITLPYLSRALSVSLGGVEIRQIAMDWPSLLRLYAVLAGCYLVALACSMLALVRAAKAGARRLSEE